MKKLYCIICGKYRKFEKHKINVFFYKHKACKHMNPQNWPKINHILSIY